MRCVPGGDEGGGGFWRWSGHGEGRASPCGDEARDRVDLWDRPV
jgi:hypothetical protein